MAFPNPSDSTEILYGASGDVRNEINSHLDIQTGGHYADEQEIPGSLVIISLRRATRLINMFLEPVYADSIPFTAAGDVPKILDEIASDIATFFVFRSSSVLLGQLSEQKRDDYYNQYVSDGKNGTQMGYLVRIAKNEIGIPELTSQNPKESQEVRSLDRPSVFDLDAITAQEVDPRLLDDIARERDGG